MGLTYGPLGTALAQMFPTAVRYTGASLAFNMAGIFGASLAPYIATWLAATHGLAYVGYYLAAAAVVTLLALLITPHSAHEPVASGEPTVAINTGAGSATGSLDLG
jgi:MFS family permease